FPLALAVAGFIIVLPLTRLAALIYALAPLVRGRSPAPYSRQAFGLAETLRPWSMAEIFMVGVSVALIKVAGLATVSLGPAFWAFAGLVIITVLKDQLICRYSIWEALDQQAT
ncbi:MAG: paraquat-inducible protein A, partial [Pseudomonadota bacterium]